MDLTPEERERIYLEEQARREARARLDEEENGDRALAKSYETFRRPVWSATRRALLQVGIGVVCFVALFMLCDRIDRARVAPSSAHPPDLEVLETEWANEEHAAYVVGGVRNNTDRRYSYVQVEFSLYDAHGYQLGSAWDNVNNLEPHGVWIFKALVPERGVEKYKLAHLSGW